MAAAFGAPLTGAFYAFELVIGAYSLANAAPVLAAAVAGALMVHVLGGAPYSIEAPHVPATGVAQHIALSGLGLVSALLGVAAMRAAAVVERGFRSGALAGLGAAGARRRDRRAAGDRLAADARAPGMARWRSTARATLSAATLVALIGLKLSACLISLASGFRGGLFFASLYVGALVGKLYAIAIAAALPGLQLDATACLFAGMATLGASIVGAPLTMTFLVLESSGDLAIVGPALAGCIASHLMTQAIFGYSFSTWRLHLRGEDIAGAHDVGWVRTILVAGLMTPRPPTMPAQASVAAFRLAHPLGASHYVALVDSLNRYRGIVSTAEAHAGAERPTARRSRAAGRRHIGAQPEHPRSARRVREVGLRYSRRRRRRGRGRRGLGRGLRRAAIRRSGRPRRQRRARRRVTFKSLWLTPCFVAERRACVGGSFGISLRLRDADRARDPARFPLAAPAETSRLFQGIAGRAIA